MLKKVKSEKDKNPLRRGFPKRTSLSGQNGTEKGLNENSSQQINKM